MRTPSSYYIDLLVNDVSKQTLTDQTRSLNLQEMMEFQFLDDTTQKRY
jgi:hypothetical protein